MHAAYTRHMHQRWMDEGREGETVKHDGKAGGAKSNVHVSYKGRHESEGKNMILVLVMESK